MRDLGVVFDEHLTFEHHINKLLTSANRVFGMAKRFTYDIHSPYTMIKLVNVYINPLLEYCSAVWNCERSSYIEKLESYRRRATRIALNTPHRPHLVGYIPYQQRIMTLGLLTQRQRRIISIVLTIIRILKGESDTDLRHILAKYQRPRGNTRTYRTFHLPRNTVIPTRSPLSIGMCLVNKYHHVIDITDTTQTIRNRLRHYMLLNPEH